MTNWDGKIIDDVWADGYEKAVVELLEALREDISLLYDAPQLARYLAIVRDWHGVDEWLDVMGYYKK